MGLSFPTGEGLGVGLPSPFGEELSNMSQKLIMSVHLYLQRAKIQINLVIFKFLANFVSRK